MAPKILLLYERDDNRYWFANAPGLAIAEGSPLADLSDKYLIYESDLLLAVSNTMDGDLVPKHHNYLASYKIDETYYVLLERMPHQDILTPLTPLSSCVSETLGVRSVHSIGDNRRGRPLDSITVGDNGHGAEPMRSGWSTPSVPARSDGNASVGQSHWTNKDEPTLHGWETPPQTAKSDRGFPSIAYSDCSAPTQTARSNDNASADGWDIKDTSAHAGWDFELANSDDGRASTSNSGWITYPQTANSENNAPVSHYDANEDVELRNEQSTNERGTMAPSPLITDQAIGNDNQSGKNDAKDDTNVNATMAHKDSVRSATSFAAKVARAGDGLKGKMPNFAKSPCYGYPKSPYPHQPAPYWSYPQNDTYSFSIHEGLSFPRSNAVPCYYEPLHPYDCYVSGEVIPPWQDPRRHTLMAFDQLPRHPAYLPSMAVAPPKCPLSPLTIPRTGRPVSPTFTRTTVPPVDPVPPYDGHW
ncbi:hypothetical protein BO94DRAFT_547639 [Aspergillus sclerotioniger CBS 115572]|uniref:Uncharacterized protein n=1 Tax=Aspergillus sclerotioniger CBS 115572 TaxID=1450535 RepID=A0A317W951_9EURO|nr:hypothetical protein BO94DRAFT_547639 [Aspergillus sclerotioniger CBS 115572]PWY83144.1 hypothetical protein BO94DRAFT_547639 [Aspergillus sclerotioniger CBS 115572]